MTDNFQILVNDQPQQADSDTTLAEAAARFGAKPPYALLLNQNFVPNSEHDRITLNPDDAIEVISAIQGG